MKNFKLLAIVMLVMQVLPIWGKTSFVPTINQVKLGTNNYVSISSENDYNTINLGNLTESKNFTQTISGNNIQTSESKRTNNFELYYTTFYTEVTIPANTKRTIDYTFNCEQTKETAAGAGTSGYMFELFNYGNISESAAATIHKNINFNAEANTSFSSEKYSFSRKEVGTFDTWAKLSDTKTISYTYDNTGNSTEMVVKQYWGYAACIRSAWLCAHDMTSSLTVTAQYDYDEDGFDNEGNCQEPEKENGYYIIKNPGNLYWFANYVTDKGNYSAKAKLANDIRVNKNVLIKGDRNTNHDNFKTWTPIANGSDKYFTGEFDGQGYTISGLYYSSTSNSNIGFISKTAEGAKVSNLTISDSYFRGKNYIGAFVGYATGLNITNCINTSTIRGSYVGGIVGYANKATNSSITISNCNNTGSLVTTGKNIGGISSYAKSCKLSNCCNTFKYGIAKTLTKSTLNNCFWFNDNTSTATGTNCCSFNVNGMTATLTNNVNGSDDLLTVLNNYASEKGYKAWSNFINEDNSKMFLLDYYAVKLSKYKWSTLCLPFNTFISMGEGDAYYAIANDNCDNIEKLAASVIPTDEGVLVNGNENEVLTFKYTTEEADEIDANDVLGTTQKGGCIFGPEEGCRFYIMSTNNGVFGFYWDKNVIKTNPALSEGKGAKCNQYKAVLKVSNMNAIKSFFALDDFEEFNETAIEENIFANKDDNKAINLAGQPTSKNRKGIVIINGKKYLNK